MSNQSINISIGGRSYPLSVKAEEEEGLRRAAKEIDAHISHLRDNYAVKDTQDLLAMTLLEYSSRLAKKEMENGQKVANELLLELEALLNDIED